MTFHVAAQDEAGTDWISQDVEAETFEDALDILRELARRRWPGQVWRPTSITEVIDLSRSGPIHLAFVLGRAVA